jgi:hypothetical protein
MASTLFKVVLVYVCIGLMLQAGGVANQLSTDFAGSDATVSSSASGSLPNVNEETGSGSGVLSFIDALRAVRDFVSFIGGSLIALPAVLLDLQIPYIVRLLLGVPMTIAAIVAIVQFARSGN